MGDTKRINPLENKYIQVYWKIEKIIIIKMSLVTPPGLKTDTIFNIVLLYLLNNNNIIIQADIMYALKITT